MGVTQQHLLPREVKRPAGPDGSGLLTAKVISLAGAVTHLYRQPR
jgi:hypothetical protein